MQAVLVVWNLKKQVNWHRRWSNQTLTWKWIRWCKLFVPVSTKICMKIAFKSFRLASSKLDPLMMSLQQIPDQTNNCSLMLVMRISREMGTLVNCIKPHCLSNVVEFAYNWAVIEVIAEERRVFESMRWLLNSSWDGFCCCFGIRETYILYDRVIEGALCES